MAKIRHKKLILELTITAMIVLGAALVSFLSWLPANDQVIDQYYEYKKLYREVETYDYSQGLSSSLEQKFHKATNPEFTSGAQLYFNLRARANYYANLGLPNTAIVSLESAYQLAPDETEYRSILRQLVEQAHLAKDRDREIKYQRYLDRTHNANV